MNLTSTNAGGSGTSGITLIYVGDAPVASFTKDKTTGANPLTVQFTSTSTGASTYYWVFGDGSTSTAQNPSHQYASVGVFNANLSVFNIYGQDTSATQAITVGEAPVASFNYTPTSAIVPAQVNVVDTSTESPTSIDWNWGDGTAHGTTSSDSHIYSVPSVYSITLTVDNAYGSDSVSHNFHAMENIHANFTTNKDWDILPSTNISFTDLSDISAPVSWLYVFGDGNTSTDQNPYHSYASAGVYQTNLTVHNSDGVSNTTGNHTITIYDVFNAVIAYPQITNVIISKGSTVYLGEEHLNILPALNAARGSCTSSTIGWWAAGQNPATTPPDISVDRGNTGATDYTLDSFTFNTYFGNWYAVNTTTGRWVGSDSLVFILHDRDPSTVMAGYNPLSVHFNTYGTGGVPPYTYNWTFWHVNRTSLTNVVEGYSNSADIVHVFNEDVNINWTELGAGVVVSDSIGNTMNTTNITGMNMYVVGKPHVSLITANPTTGTGLAPLSVVYDYTYDLLQGAYPTNQRWVSSSTVSYDVSPTFIYNVGGNYTISIDLSNPSGNSTLSGVYRVLPAYPSPSLYWVDSAANPITEAYIGANTSVYLDTGNDGVKGHETLILDQFKVDISVYDPITGVKSGLPLTSYSVPTGLVRHTGYISSTFTPTTEGSYYAELYGYNTTYGGTTHYASSVLKVNQNPLTASNWGGWVNGFGGAALGFIITMILCAVLMTVPYLVTRSFNMYIELMMLIIGLGIGSITGLIWFVWAIIFGIIGVMVILLVNYEGSEVSGGGGQIG